jgi:hypothetical protein
MPNDQTRSLKLQSSNDPNGWKADVRLSPIMHLNAHASYRRSACIDAERSARNQETSIPVDCRKPVVLAGSADALRGDCVYLLLRSRLSLA